MRRFDLTDSAWSVPVTNKPRNVPRVNDRRVLNGRLPRQASEIRNALLEEGKQRYFG